MKKFVSFLLLQCVAVVAFGQATDTTTAEKKARYNIDRIRDNTIRAITPADFRNAFRAVADLAVKRVPYLSMHELRQGKADTARVVQVVDDLKAGVFRYDPTDNISADDSAMVIRNGNRRYKRVFDGGVNVRWFGAKGKYSISSGTGTDDRAYFQKAVDFAYQNNVDLLIPFDTYYLSASVGRSDVVAGKRIRILGQGATIVMLATNAEKSMFRFTAAASQSFPITIKSDVKARQNVQQSELSKIQVSALDAAKLSSGDVFRIDTYIHSTNSAYNGKLSSSEWSTISQINDSSNIFIPSPLMPVYAAAKVIDTDYSILTTYQNASQTVASVQVYKQYELEISGLNFVADFRNSGNSRLYGIYALQGITSIDNCTYRAFPEDNIPGEGGVDYGLNRVLCYLANCRDVRITNCRLENYGYGIWLNRGFNAIVDNVFGKKGRHLVASHGWTKMTLSNIVCTTGGAFDAHGGASDWTLTNVTANNSVNPKGVVEDLNNIRVQVGNIRMVNCNLLSPTIGMNTTDYWNAVFVNSGATGKYGYETRIKPSSFEAVNSTFRTVSNWGRYTNLTNCIIDRLATQEQNLPISGGGTFGGLPSYVNLNNCRTSTGKTLGAASNQSGRNIIVSGNAQSNGAYYPAASQIVTMGKKTAVADTSTVTLPTNTIFVFATPDVTVIPDADIDYNSMAGSGGKSLKLRFSTNVSFSAIPADSVKFNIVFLLGNYGIPNSASKARATIRLASNSNASGSLNVSRHQVGDEVSFYLAHNINAVPLIYRNFALPKAAGSGTAFTLNSIRTHNYTTNTGNLSVGFPQDYINGATAVQAGLLARNGFEMDITLVIPGTSPTLSGMFIEGEILINQ